MREVRNLSGSGVFIRTLRSLRLVSPLPFLLLVAACSVASSLPVVDPKLAFIGCTSKLGAYALPRKVLHIKISRETASGDYVLETLDVKNIPDNAHHYCFEHTGNAFATDDVKVYKTKITENNNTFQAALATKPKNMQGEFEPVSINDANAVIHATPYLQLVASKAVDHTAGIIRNIIKAAFVGISSNPDFSTARASVNLGTGGKIVVADHQVDPFDHVEMAEVNEAIRRFGFCIALENYTYNLKRHTPSQYCDRPVRSARHYAPTASEAVRKLRWQVPKPASGIFYRPRAPYQVDVYTKHHPDDPGDWSLAHFTTVEMENIMPVVSVGIRREVFAERRTGLIFDDGLLQNVCITKGNSLTGATEIVLDVVYSVIALPSATIEATIDDVQTRKAIVAAETDLINAQKRYIAFLDDPKAQGSEITYSPKTIDANKGKQLNLKNTSGTDPQARNPAGTVTEHAIRGGSNNPLNDICEKLQAANVVSGTEEF